MWWVLACAAPAPEPPTDRSAPLVEAPPAVEEVPEPRPSLPRDRVFVRIAGADRSWTVSPTGEVREHAAISMIDVARERLLSFEGNTLMVRQAVDAAPEPLHDGLIPEQLLVMRDGALLSATLAGTLVRAWPDPARLGWASPVPVGRTLLGKGAQGAWWSGTDDAGRPCLRMPYRGWFSPHAPRFRPGLGRGGGERECWSGTRWERPRDRSRPALGGPVCAGCVPEDVIRGADRITIWRTGTGASARHTWEGGWFGAVDPTPWELYEPSGVGIPSWRPVGLSLDGAWALGCPMTELGRAGTSTRPPACGIVPTEALIGATRAPRPVPVHFGFAPDRLVPVPVVWGAEAASAPPAPNPTAPAPRGTRTSRGLPRGSTRAPQ